jgi:phage-related minor tail protein
MANHESSWILNLVNNITAPARDVVRSVSGITESVEGMADSVTFSERDIKEALTNAKTHYKDLQKSVADLEREMKQLERVQNVGGFIEARQAAQAYAQAEIRMNGLREAMQGAEQDMRDLTEQSAAFERQSQDWASMFTGINQGLELADKAVGAMDFTSGIEDLKVSIQRMTDTSGEQLDNLTAKAFTLGETFKESPEDIARAANAMTKQIGGSYEENLALIQQGYEKGANLNGDFLDQLKEYGPQLKELGLSGSQSIALMAKAGKDGVFSDKAIDSIKEANLSLREMDQAQVDALAGIKMKPEDLAGKTAFEAVQLITKQMEGATTQARQLVMADIFKGAGEDAGFKFVEGLSSVDLDINKIPSYQESGTGITQWLSDLKTSFSNTFGGIASSVVQIAPVVTGVASMIPIFQALSQVTWIQAAATKIATAAQWVWNAAMTANPIGLIIAAVAALVAAIVWVASKTTGWGEMWKHTVEGAKLLFMAFVESAKWYFNTLVNGLMIGINLIKVGWYEFKNAMGIGDEAENNDMLAKIHADTEARKNAIVDGAKKINDLGKKAKEEFILAANSVKWKDEKQAEKKTAKGAAGHDFSTMGGDAPKLDGASKLTASGAAGAGSSGPRVLNMTINVKQDFNVRDGADWLSRKKQILDEIVGELNDSLKDSLIVAG